MHLDAHRIDLRDLAMKLAAVAAIDIREYRDRVLDGIIVAGST
jgi:hypothetical protein